MNYTLTISESERQILAEAFGILARKLGNCAPVLDSKSALPPTPETTPPAAAQASASPIALRDRWARDRKGNEVPNPEGAEPRDIRIWKTEQKEKYLKVTWQSQERGYVDANCFERQLWPWLVARTGQEPTRVYVARKDKFLNIVGVRA